MCVMVTRGTNAHLQFYLERAAQLPRRELVQRHLQTANRIRTGRTRRPHTTNTDPDELLVVLVNEEDKVVVLAKRHIELPLDRDGRELGEHPDPVVARLASDLDFDISRRDETEIGRQGEEALTLA
jgi:hypothetical protein